MTTFPSNYQPRFLALERRLPQFNISILAEDAEARWNEDRLELRRICKRTAAGPDVTHPGDTNL